MAEHRRNVSQCWDGWATCDRSKLSTTELSAVIVADHQRNYTACVGGYMPCDHAALTSVEAGSLAAESKTATR